MTLRVDSPGMLSTIQDCGRPGHGIQGVSRAGAADSLALRLGNLLLGNPANTPAIEMTLLGGTFTFPEGATISLTGAHPAAHPANTTIRLAPGETLRVGPFATGARCYLCVQGGIQTPRIAGSASTHLPSGLGGAPLKRGDVLKIGQPIRQPQTNPIPPALLEYKNTLRVTRGPQAALFPDAPFFTEEYKVSQDSNRMGIRLEGPAIPNAGPGNMVTEGVPLGAIQVPPNGLPIILFVDQQTTGGYPKIANVITADLPSAGQLRPRDPVRFQLVSNDEAQQALRLQESLLAQL